MSKNLRIGLAILVTLIIGSVAIWELKFKNTKTKEPTEVTIKEATLPMPEITVYKDAAGFKFNYPAGLTIKEIETDDATIYSSLELTAPNNEKLNLRITDTIYNNVLEWLQSFEKNNPVSSSKEIGWEIMAAKQLTYSSPKRLKTIAIENNISYSLDSLLDKDSYWEKTQNMILSSFEFTAAKLPTASPVSTTPTESTNEEDIVLIEETVQ